MSNKPQKVSENVAGRYYVDQQCIYCGLCTEFAPNNFKHLREQGCAVVFRQPATPEEEQACRKVKDECPSDSIWDDGVSS